MTRRFPKLSELKPVDDDGAINVVIETSRDARIKLAYDEDHAAMVLKKLLPQGMSFPFDFGFIPSTLADDGDPLDVLVLIDAPIPAGVIVPSRLIGVIEARQTEKNGEVDENDRLIAVAETSELFRDVKKLGDLPDAVTDQFEHFFMSYNEQESKKFEVVGQHGPKRALYLFEQGRKRFRSRGKK